MAAFVRVLVDVVPLHQALVVASAWAVASALVVALIVALVADCCAIELV